MVLSFIKSERNAAVFIVLAGLLGLIFANQVSGFEESLKSIHHFAELALAIFFFYIGLELKDELTNGVFVNRKALLIPGFAALIGAMIPAGLYYLVTYSDPIASKGWAIPMATDITFALAVFTIFGSRMPRGSRQFLLAFAIIDDLLAILVIAMFLRSDVVTALIVTGSAVIGLLIPSKSAHRLQELLLPLINLIVLPLYAFSSLGIKLDTSIAAVVTSVVGIGVLLRVVGKSIGITIGAYLGSKFSKDSLSRKTYARLSVLGGIGFTVAFFVNDIVFKDQELFHKQALIASLLAALITVLIASFTLKNRQK